MTATCKDWYAWLNTMPPRPDDFHVTGDVMVSNPGIIALLTMKSPQGINPDILLLDLHLVQQPGMWIQVMTCAQARFDRVMPPGSKLYTAVEIFSDGKRIALIDKIDIVS
jgi:hypothetical protein